MVKSKKVLGHVLQCQQETDFMSVRLYKSSHCQQMTWHTSSLTLCHVKYDTIFITCFFTILFSPPTGGYLLLTAYRNDFRSDASLSRGGQCHVDGVQKISPCCSGTVLTPAPVFVGCSGYSLKRSLHLSLLLSLFHTLKGK